MIQQRRHPRYRLGSLKLNGHMTYSSEVSILDIGMGGVSLTADQRLNIGGRYTLKLDVSDKVIPVTCQVVWARLSGTKKSAAGDIVPVYTAGMKFVGLPQDVAAHLRNLIEAASGGTISDDDRREHPRVPTSEPAIALLDFPAEYQVKTISLSGMLIESGTAIESEKRVPIVLYLQDGGRTDLLGRIVSCRSTSRDAGNRYDIGIEFVEPSDPARDALAAFLVSLPTTEGGPGPA